MVWPLNQRRQMPFGRRQIPYFAPPQARYAPLELLRSQLYPMDPQSMLPGIQQGLAGDYPPNHWLPLRMVQQQWKKDSCGFYQPYLGGAPSFVAAVTQSGSTMRTVRHYAPKHPSYTWDEMSQEQAASMNIGRGAETRYHPLGRDIPGPQRLPNQAFDQLDDIESYAHSQQQLRLRNQRMQAMREVRLLDAIYGRFTEPQR